MFKMLEDFNISTLTKFASGFSATVNICKSGLPDLRNLKQILMVECKSMIDAIDGNQPITPHLSQVLRFGVITIAVQSQLSLSDAMDKFLITSGNLWNKM